MKVLVVIVTFLIVGSNAGLLSGVLNPLKNLQDAATAQSKAKDLLESLREHIKDVFDSDAIREKIEQLFGKGSDIAKQLREKLKDKYIDFKQKILDFIDKVLDDKKEEDKSANSESSILDIVNPLIQALSANIASGNIPLKCFTNEIPNINANINAVADHVNATLNGSISAVEACGDVECVDQLVMLRLTNLRLKVT